MPPWLLWLLLLLRRLQAWGAGPGRRGVDPGRERGLCQQGAGHGAPGLRWGGLGQDVGVHHRRGRPCRRAASRRAPGRRWVQSRQGRKLVQAGGWSRPRHARPAGRPCIHALASGLEGAASLAQGGELCCPPPPAHTMPAPVNAVLWGGPCGALTPAQAKTRHPPAHPPHPRPPMNAVLAPCEVLTPAQAKARHTFGTAGRPPPPDQFVCSRR